MAHHDAADLRVTLRFMLFYPAQQRGRMPGPQRLAGDRIQLLRDAVLLPALDDIQRPAIGGEHGIAQWPILFIQEKQPLALRRNTDPGNLFAHDAGAL